MKVLVVGGAGYIGYEVCKSLDHEVWSLDPNNSRAVQLMSNKVRTVVDVVENVRKSPVMESFDAVVNLTGGLDDSDIWGDLVPAQLQAVPLLRAACPDARIVHISTQYVFGIPEFNKERNKPSPKCGYGVTHCMAESALVSDGNSVILRFGTVWGDATFMRHDTWGNHFQAASADVVFPQDLICLLSMKNALKVIAWALDSDSLGIYNVADEIGYREDLAAKFVGDLDIRPREGGISVGMNCTKISRAGFSFDEVVR